MKSERNEFTMQQSEKTMDMITGLCKTRGFIFPGSEIYGGLANTWDYGPLGAGRLAQALYPGAAQFL